MATWTGQVCFERAGETGVLHAVPDRVEDTGWGQALCGETSFSWHCAGDPDEAVGTPCPACTERAGTS